jgi:4-amino-4-deoxy-L-arabinose transferase-like glycosyltransferase
MNKKRFLIFFIAIVALAAALRVYKLSSLPPSPYWEEVALGYDAYSILKTGKDHHGQSFPLVAFESFGDWKPSLYFYSIVPFVQVFGLSVLSVRLPAVLSGLLIVIGVGLLARLLIAGKKKSELAQLIAMAITAISPWSIQFSRAGWEVNLASALILWGVLFFLFAVHKKGKTQLAYFCGAVILWGLSMYAYHAARIIAPLLGLSLGLWFVSQKRLEGIKNLLVPGIVILSLLIPLFQSLRSNTVTQRFAETSIFSDLSVIEESNERKSHAGNTFFSSLMYHRYVLFGREILINALSHFHPQFLFVSGDSNPRHSVQYMGQLYHVEVIFLFLGVVYGVTHWRKKYLLLPLWLVIGLLPASISHAAPHALRILPTLPVFMVVITMGILQLKEWLPKLVLPILVIVYAGELLMFWRFYSTIYPKLYSQQWQYGYEQAMKDLGSEVNKDSQMPAYVTREQGRPVMYYFFFNQIDPQRVQAAELTAKQDQGELLQFENISFINSVAEVASKPAIVVSSLEQKEEFEQNNKKNQSNVTFEEISRSNDLMGKAVWVIYRVK